MIAVGIILIVCALAILAVALRALDQAREHSRDIPREALRAIERVQLQAAREREDLLSRMMHLVNRTWDLPPHLVTEMELMERREQARPLDEVPAHIVTDPGSGGFAYNDPELADLERAL